jgi:hypothetical protein
MAIMASPIPGARTCQYISSITLPVIREMVSLLTYLALDYPLATVADLDQTAAEIRAMSRRALITSATTDNPATAGPHPDVCVFPSSTT